MSRAAPPVDLLVIGAGPTGIAVAAEARREGLSTLVVDQGPLCASLQSYPTDLTFFTTRERLEIAGVPFTIPDVKPNRRQALVYYREVVRRYEVPLALYETVQSVEKRGEADFLVRTVQTGSESPSRLRTARTVVVATGYFHSPKRLEVPGEDLPWVETRYIEPYPYFDRDVVVVGGANSAAKTALDLWRNGARVTLVHHRPELSRSIKYWLRPDLLNRIAEGSIRAFLDAEITAFSDADSELGRRTLVRRQDGEIEVVASDAAIVLIGYIPDPSLLLAAGVEVDPETAVPVFDEVTCETNLEGLYVAGTVQAGRFTNKIFIENSRDHGIRIVRHFQG